jgi:hypothetical protein
MKGKEVESGWHLWNASNDFPTLADSEAHRGRRRRRNFAAESARAAGILSLLAAMRRKQGGKRAEAQVKGLLQDGKQICQRCPVLIRGL